MQRISTTHAGEAAPNSQAKIAKREVGGGGGSQRTITATANDLTDSASKGGSGGANGTGVNIRNATNEDSKTNNNTSVISGSSNGRVVASGAALLLDPASMWNICPILMYRLLTPNNGSCLGTEEILVTSLLPELHAGHAENDRALGKWMSGWVGVCGRRLRVNLTYSGGQPLDILLRDVR